MDWKYLHYRHYHGGRSLEASALTNAKTDTDTNSLRRRRDAGRQRETLPQAEGHVQGLSGLPGDGGGTGRRIHDGLAGQ